MQHHNLNYSVSVCYCLVSEPVYVDQSAVKMIVTPTAVFIVLIFTSATVRAVFVTNLTPVCMRCLCHAASNCNLTLGCVEGFCGPFQLSRGYWRDAGRYVLPEDSPNREGAFLDCALEYSCGQHIVEEYLVRYAKDCNHDGVTDCDDYAMLHFNLKDECTASLEGTNFGRRYSTCRPTVDPTGH